jgi:hypothetical protein
MIKPNPRPAKDDGTAMNAAPRRITPIGTLRVVARDDMAAAVAAFHATMGPAASDVTEYPDKRGVGPTLFRHSFGVDSEQSMHSIPAYRLTPHVREKLRELMDAIEAVAP